MRSPAASTDSSAAFVLAIHGGTGNITPETLPPDQERACRDALAQVLASGHALLSRGASSLDVVEAAVRMLEDTPLFNAGRGACFTSQGSHELDAAIMDGRTQRAGAVAGVTNIRNPVSAARAVLERSPYVLLIGSGAEEFAAAQGLDTVEQSYFHTQHQHEKHLKMLRSLQEEEAPEPPAAEKWGTVGAVAVDSAGNVAAATSTGGMDGKRYGRVGDSPIIGAGTYASNATCAVSATGHGEHFLRNVVAYDIAALIEYKGLSLQEATEEAVTRKLGLRGGEGGVIAVDATGRVSITFNSPGMHRGSIDARGQSSIHSFK